MRILNRNTDEVLKDVLLLLTESEASELKDELDRLISSTQRDNHGHINDDDYRREITLAIYNDNNLDSFDEKVRKLITEDK